MQLGQAIFVGMLAAGKGGFPRAAGLLLAGISGFMLLPVSRERKMIQGERVNAIALVLSQALCSAAALWHLKGSGFHVAALAAVLSSMILAGFPMLKGFWMGRILAGGLLPGLYALVCPVAAPVYAVTLDMPFYVLVTALVYIPPMVDGKTRRWQGAALLCLAVLYGSIWNWLSG